MKQAFLRARLLYLQRRSISAEKGICTTSICINPRSRLLAPVMLITGPWAQNHGNSSQLTRLLRNIRFLIWYHMMDGRYQPPTCLPILQANLRQSRSKLPTRRTMKARIKFINHETQKRATIHSIGILDVRPPTLKTITAMGVRRQRHLEKGARRLRHPYSRESTKVFHHDPPAFHQTCPHLMAPLL